MGWPVGLGISLFSRHHRKTKNSATRRENQNSAVLCISQATLRQNRLTYAVPLGHTVYIGRSKTDPQARALVLESFTASARYPITPSPPMTTTNTAHNHLRAMWNLYTDLLIKGNTYDAKLVREAITIAERNEIDADGKY